MVELGVHDDRVAAGKPGQQWNQAGIGNLLSFREQAQVLEELPLTDAVQVSGVVRMSFNSWSSYLTMKGVVADVETERLARLLPQGRIVAKDDFLICHDLWSSVVVTVQRNLPRPVLILLSPMKTVSG